MVTIARQSTSTPKAYNMDPDGRRSTFDKVYLGFVQDNIDAERMGRIKAWIPELCGPKENDSTWIICDYCAPFGGSSGSQTNTSGTSYGMWFTPQVGANVIVTFINGDPNRAIYLGCMYPIDQHRQTPSGRTNSPDPVKETNNVIGSATVRTVPNAADASASAATVGTGSNPPDTPPSAPAAQAAIVNAAGTNLPGLRNIAFSSDNSYHVFGIRTPAGNSITMSDQEGAGEIRIQTFNMMQLIMNAQTGAIVIMNGDGSARVEIKRDGGIDVYGKGNVSIAADNDLNLIGRQNVNIDAAVALNVRAGTGGVRMMSETNLTLFSVQNMFLTSLGEQHRYSNNSIYDMSSNKIYRKSNYGIHDQTIGGNINQYAIGSIRSYSIGGNIDLKTTGNFSIQNDGTFNVFSSGDIKLTSKDGTGNFRSSQPLRITSDQKVEISAVNGVYTDFSTYIDTGASTPASVAGQAALAEGANNAIAGERPRTYNHTNSTVIPGSTSGAGGLASGDGRQYSVSTSVASSSPGAEPYVERYVASPGYSNTNTIERDEAYSAGWKLGQIDPSQRVPLQVMGYISGAYTIVPPNSYGLNDSIMEAVRGVQAGYPKAVLSSTVRSGDAGQHGSRNAVDFTLDRLSQSERAALVNEVARDIEAGTGYFRYVRGVGMYDTEGRLLHLDSRPQNQSLVRNGMDVWGENRSITGVAGTTPAWFQQALKVVNGRIGLRPATPQPSTPAASTPSSPVEPNSQPMRYIGIGYNTDGSPRYNQEAVPNETFRLASAYAGPLNGLSENGLHDISNFETLRGPWPMDIPNRKFFHACAARPDRADQPPTSGISMIGYGHKLTDAEYSSNKITIKGNEVDISNGITEAQALDLLKQDLEPFVSNIKAKITQAITQQQFDSMVDFSWNIGLEKFNSSECKVVTLMNEKKYDQVPNEMVRWIRACGSIKAELLSRRQANSRRFSGNMRPDSPANIVSQGTANPTARLNGTNMRIVYCFLLSKFDGNHAWAAGFCANLEAESGYNPAAFNSAGGGYGAIGIAQWRGPRVNAFNSNPQFNVKGPLQSAPQAATGENARSWLDLQLQYLWWELTSTEERRTLNSLRRSVSNADPEGAADIVCREFERPGPGFITTGRQTRARAIYTQFTSMENPCGA